MILFLDFDGVTHPEPYAPEAAFTQLGDDSVKMDHIALLLLALERAGVIPTEDVVPLHINYLREKLKDSLAQTHIMGAALRAHNDGRRLGDILTAQ